MGWDVALPLLIMVLFFATAVPIWVSLGFAAIGLLWLTDVLPLTLFGEALFSGIDAFALIVHRDDAYHKDQRLFTKLRKLIPRQLFEVPIQASAAGRVISRANVKALRKDVLAKCYGGDVTRKRKLLEKQKKGKKRMKTIGSVDIPQEAFLAVLRLGDY